MRNCKHREKERVKASLSLASSLCTVTINMLTRCQNYGRRELTKPGRVTEPVLRALSLSLGMCIDNRAPHFRTEVYMSGKYYTSGVH